MHCSACPRSVYLLLACLLSLLSLPAAALTALQLDQQQLLVKEVVGQIQQQPGATKSHLIYAGRDSRYQNTLDAGDLDSLIRAKEAGEQAVAKAAEGLLEDAPIKLVSVHRESIGRVTLGQLNAIESMVQAWVVDGRLSIEQDRVAIKGGSGLNPWLLGGGVAAGVALAGGGGGGGGGATPTFSPPSFAVSAQYNADYGHAMVGTMLAHDRGYTGSGAVVSIMDSGFDDSHPELNGQFLNFYNALTAASGAAASGDPTGHGTWVAGVIGAKLDATNVTGVAPGAQLVGIRIADNSGDFSAMSDVQFKNAVDFAIAQGSDFVNNSWGLSAAVGEVDATTFQTLFPVELQAYRDGVAADMVFVFANGNERDTSPSQPQLLAGLPALFADLDDHWVAVGAVGPDGRLASYSQPCGSAAAWCLVAPGGDDGSSMTSTWLFNGYATGVGTSYSTPMVTGALAVLKSRFPTLSNDVIVDRLFLTANKSGIYADSSLYGQGLLDLEKATNPVGPLAVVNPLMDDRLGQQALLLEDLSLESAPAFGDALVQSLMGQSMAVADSQGAGFFIDLGAKVKPAAAVELQTLVDRLQPSPALQTAALNNEQQLQFDIRGAGQAQRMESLLFSQQQAWGDVRLGYVGNQQHWATLSHETAEMGYYSGGRYLQPYSAADQSLWVLQFGQDVGAWRWGGSLLSPRGQDGLTNQPGAQLVVGSLAWQSNNGWGLQAQVGYGRESDQLLGADFGGAFALADNTELGFVGLSGKYHFNRQTHLQAAAFIGRSRPETVAHSLVQSVSELISSSFALGLEHQWDHQRLGFSLSQPLRVESGRMQLTLSDGYQGNRFNQTTRQLALQPSARQLDVEMFYRSKRLDGADLKLALVQQHNPGHINVKTEYLLLLGLNQPF